MKSFFSTFFVLSVLLLAGCSGARPSAQQESASAGPFLYAANEGGASVSIIDMRENNVVRTIDLTQLGFSENAKPHDVVVEPDGSYWYVSLIGANRILKFNRANELVGQVEFEVPGMMALDPTSSRLLVGRSMSAVNPPKRVGILDREQMTIEQVGVLFPRPHAIAVTPSGSRAYSASLANNRMAAIDPAAQEVELKTVDGPLHTLVQFEVAPDGQTMVAGGQMSGELLFFDLSGSTPSVAKSLSIGGQPWHPAYTPDGSRIYIGNKTDNAVTVIDAENRRVETVIEGNGLAQPHGAAVRPDGRFAYVSNENLEGDYEAEVGTVVVIDTQTDEIVKVLEIGKSPAGLGAPAQMN